MHVNSDCSADIDIQVANHGPHAHVVVTVVGQIDTPAALELATVLNAQLPVARILVVNLDGVSLLGSAGLSALFDVNELATQQDRALRLVCNSRIANSALEGAGLREYFTIARSVADALDDSSHAQHVIEPGSARRSYRSRNHRPSRRSNGLVRSAAAPRES